MSEIVGYILTFAILSTVLLIAMVTFGAANQKAEQRVLEVEAASVAHRVAAAIVEADLYAGTRNLPAAPAQVQGFSLRLELPASFGRDGYSIELCDSSPLSPDDACGATACSASSANMDTVRVATRGAVAQESILGATARRSCVAGGDVEVRWVSVPATAPYYSLELVQA